MTGDNPTYVLYVDHQGHPAPLSLCYHATASRRLTSSVDRHPPSSVTEIDSAYCPQCLSFHDANTARNLGFCPKATCRLCPICRSVASVTVSELKCFYKCGLCDWNSKLCGLESPLDSSAANDDAIDLKALEKATSELLSQLETKKEESNKESEHQFATMEKHLINIAKEKVKGHRSSAHRAFSSELVTKRRERGDLKGWSIEALEESRNAIKKELNVLINNHVGGTHLEKISLEGENEALYDSSLEGLSPEMILCQETGDRVARSREMLMPLPIPLRPRKSRRCRQELLEGRPGILLKPKLNPLEGDSSLRTGHGQWWKKDSSAIEVLPRVHVCNDASDGSRHAFLLKVSNPTLGIVRLRIIPSAYTGEPIWDSDSNTTKYLESLNVDPVKRIAVDACLDINVAKGIRATSLTELEPVEDSFLEMGSKTSSSIPEVVRKWQAQSTLSSSNVSVDKPAMLRKLDQKQAVAWFELIVMEPNDEDFAHVAVPITMQLQVGEGSWESSLVQYQDDGNNDSKDFASFDLVIIWKKE